MTYTHHKRFDDLHFFVTDEKPLSHKEEILLARQRITAENATCKALYSTDAGRITLAYALHKITTHSSGGGQFARYLPAPNGYAYWYAYIFIAQQKLREDYQTKQDTLQRRKYESHRTLAQELNDLLLAHALFPAILAKVPTIKTAKFFTHSKKTYRIKIEHAQDAYTDYKTAINTLIKHNLRLVVHVTKKIVGNDHPQFYELILAGQDGLMHAAATYDPESRETCPRFSTHATQWIRQAVLRANPNITRNVRRPVHTTAFAKRINDAQNKLAQEYFREPTLEEIAQELHEKPSTITNVLRATAPEKSLDMPAEDDDSQTLLDTIQTLPDQKTDLDIHNKLESLISKLSPYEQNIIKARVGLQEGPAQTLDEIARPKNVSREAIRQREVNGLAKLARHARKDPELLETYGQPLPLHCLSIGHTERSQKKQRPAHQRLSMTTLLEDITTFNFKDFVSNNIYKD